MCWFGDIKSFGSNTHPLGAAPVEKFRHKRGARPPDSHAEDTIHRLCCTAAVSIPWWPPNIICLLNTVQHLFTLWIRSHWFFFIFTYWKTNWFSSRCFFSRKNPITLGFNVGGCCFLTFRHTFCVAIVQMSLTVHCVHTGVIASRLRLCQLASCTATRSRVSTFHIALNEQFGTCSAPVCRRFLSSTWKQRG